MGIEFFPIIEHTEIQVLAKLADEVWHEYFVCILSNEQIDYMVEKFQSEAALTEQITRKGYAYFILQSDGTNAGYVGIKVDRGRIFLSKLYVKKEFRGKGISREAMEFLKGLGEAMELSSIWLTVNKYNEHSIEVYKHFGFEKIRDEVTDIGNGFVMDDYVFELKLSN